MRKKSITAIMVGCLIMTGCSFFPSGGYSDSQREVETVVSEDNRIQAELNEAAKIDAEVVIPEGYSWNYKIAKYRNFDEDTVNNVISLIARDKTIQSYNTRNGKTMENVNVYEIKFRDDGTLTMNGEQGTINYSTTQSKNNQYIGIVYDNNNRITKNINEILPLNELPDYSKKEADKYIREICGKLSIEILDNPMVCVMDYEHINEYAKMEEAKGRFEDKEGNKKPEWNSNDSAYLFTYRIGVDGIAISDMGFNNDSYITFGSKLDVVINKSGIIYFNALALYDVISTKEIEKEICQVSEVLKVLDNRYKYLEDSGSNLEFKKMQLEYLPIRNGSNYEFTFTPCWTCSYESLYRDNIHLNRKNIYVNAVNKTVIGAS